MLKNINSITIILFLVLFNISVSKSETEESENIQNRINTLQNDIKTLEKAVYSLSNSSSVSGTSSSLSEEDIMTRHLLKLSEIEEQFKTLTNRFEEINFKIDKLSSRISKIQSDNQLRFEDLEAGGVVVKDKKKRKKLPGTGEEQEIGRISESDVEEVQEVQSTLSVDATTSVVTEKAERSEAILPKDKNVGEQYDFALSFIKVGDYDTAEVALKEFVTTYPEDKLAGNAQYWYGETFRIRQLYNDAATAYLDGYQKYPQSAKAPLNLLKLGITLVQIGEKSQGCNMISGVKTQYPEADKSILQKAQYEEKKFKCSQKS